MTILVTGASGLIGRAFRAAARARGAEVRELVRREPRAPYEFRWDPASGQLDAAALAGCDAVVHLAGENIAGGRWTAARRRRIVGSRVGGTRLVAQAVAAAPEPPAVLVCASAVGWYGDRGDEELDEDSAAGTGFLAETCRDWEAAAAPAADAARVVHLRFGVVLDPAGGALARMLPPFRLGLGGPLGSGRQWMPWLTRAHAVAAIERALACPDLTGPYNTVAGSVRNRDFARTLGRVLGRPAVLPAPAFALRLMFGEMADQVLLGGQRVTPRRLPASGLRPEHEELEAALRAVLGR